jgi:hypothetical protein
VWCSDQRIACMPLRLHICKQETRRAIETSRAFTNKWRHLFSLQSSLLIFATTPLPLRSSHSTPAPSQPRLDFIAMRLGRVSQSWEDSVPVTCSMVVTNNAHSQLCHQTISTRRARSRCAQERQLHASCLQGPELCPSAHLALHTRRTDRRAHADGHRHTSRSIFSRQTSR